MPTFRVHFTDKTDLSEGYKDVQVAPYENEDHAWAIFRKHFGGDREIDFVEQLEREKDPYEL